MSAKAYLVLLAAVGIGRLIEMRLSRRNQRWLTAQGASKVVDPWFRWMVLFHIGLLISAGLEVVALRRPLIPSLFLVMTLLFVCAYLMRWWVIRTLSGYWNIEVMDSARLGVVTAGPYRWVRHPNYAAVFVELIALPLMHTAWLTALLGSVVHLWILGHRIAVEESVLLAEPAYRTTMGSKPRFLPRLFSCL